MPVFKRPRQKKLRAEAAAEAGPAVVPPPPLVLVHGLSVPRLVLEPLAWRMRGYGRRTHNLAFNTWFKDVPSCALAVSKAVAKLELEEFDAVTHSMGAIILRWAMNHCEMPRLRRAVLIAPPNAGAWLADHLSWRLGWTYPWIYGEAGLQMRAGWRGLAARAGQLDGAEVGVIAAGSGTPAGKRNWFGIPGDNDGVVAVEETIVPGMKDFVLLNFNHTSVSFSSHTAHMTNLFLDHGVFRPRPVHAVHEEEE